MAPEHFFWHEVKFPIKFQNPHWVETTDGAFTLAVDWHGNGVWSESDREELARLTRQVLKNLFGRVDQYTPTMQEIKANEKKEKEPEPVKKEEKSLNPIKFLKKLWKRK